MKIAVFILLCLSSLACTGLVSHKREHWVIDRASGHPCFRDIEIEILKEIEQGDFEAGILDDSDNKLEFYKPQVVKEKQRNISTFDNKITSIYAKGMTTRDIQERILEICGAEISPSAISYVTERVTAVAQELQIRPLDAVYLRVLFDTIHSKVKKSIYTCIGILRDGEKEVFGLWVGQEEGVKFWRGICSELKNRGIKKIFIASVDGPKGLSEAIKEAFPGVKIRRCIIHLIRESIKCVPNKYSKDFTLDLKNIYRAPTLQSAEANLLVLQEKWEQRYPLAVAPWVKNWDDVKRFFRFPDEVREWIYTINVVETLFKQFRK